MTANKVKIFHFHNGRGGGVLSVIQNIIRYSVDSSLEHHVIHVINKKDFNNFNKYNLKGAKSETIFYYSSKSNFYYSCRKLAKLLPSENAIVIAHDWFELGMATNLGLQNPVVQFLHGDYEYYYQLAKKHSSSIDRYITVSNNIFLNLCSTLPNEATLVTHCKFPVPHIKSIQKNNRRLRAFFCVRRLDDTNKQFLILPHIDKKLKGQGITIEWTIIGEGLSTQEREKIWAEGACVTYYDNISNESVAEMLPKNDVFILPSIKEGFPVSLVEAMKAGLVPLVTNWSGATDELIFPGRTGFYFEVGDADAYASQIAVLHNDRRLLKKLSVEGKRIANLLFDPYKNVAKIEDVILDVLKTKKKNKVASKVYGSTLDQLWLPNLLTSSIRSFF